MSIRLFLMGFLCLALGMGSVRADMDVLELESARHDRFYEGLHKDFIGAAYNWDGIGQAAGNGPWATMISPTYFLSANHWHPTAGNTITFYIGNSLSGVSFSYTVDSWSYAVTNAGKYGDLWMGRFTEPVDASIPIYPILALDQESDYIGLELWAYGRPNRVGLNTLDAIEEYTAELDYNARIMKFDYDQSGASGPDECHLIGGDSGGPTFVVWRDQLALLGIHFTTSDTSPFPTDPMWSGDSFVPFYIDQLNAQMGDESLRLVPEPASVFAMVGGGLALWLRRRRNSSVKSRR